jgi:PIN domain nuclease of toxin-antitoxin system
VKLDREPTEWVRGLVREDRIVVAPLSIEAAAWAGSLGGGFPDDPTDRLVYATARDLRIPFVSKDERLRDFADRRGDVKVIW